MRSRLSLVCAAALGIAMFVGCAPTPTTKYDVAKKQMKQDKNFTSAAKSFSEFLADPANKESQLNPYAQYNIALCYRGMYKKAEAMAAYKEVVAKYPASEPAKWAEAEMRELEKMTLVAPTTTMKPTTTTVKATTTTAKATTTTVKAKAAATTVKVTTTTVKAKAPVAPTTTITKK